MRFLIFKLFGRFTWSLRKISFNKQKGFVAYLGTDVNPPPRADIIIIPKSSIPKPTYHFQRSSNRMICFSDYKALPLRDKSITHFILSNALDFSLQPRQLLDEVVRVAKSGYIESPNVLLERFYPHPIRVSELAISDDSLLVSIKTNPVQDKFLSRLQLYKNDSMWKALFSFIPYLFFIRLNWKDSINYKILGEKPRTNNSKKMWPKGLPCNYKKISHKRNVSSFFLFILNQISSFKRRRRMSLKIIKDIFECPLCKESLIAQGEYFQCKKCTTNIDKNTNPDSVSE